MKGILEQLQQDSDLPSLDIAAALAKLSLGERSLLVKPGSTARKERSGAKGPIDARQDARDSRSRSKQSGETKNKPKGNRGDIVPATDMELFRIEVGYDHDVEPRNIVGAIANEAGLDAQNIGRIDIQPSHSIVELPTGMPKPIFVDLKKAWVCGQQLKISRLSEEPREDKKRKKTFAGESRSNKSSGGHNRGRNKKSGVNDHGQLQTTAKKRPVRKKTSES